MALTLTEGEHPTTNNIALFASPMILMFLASLTAVPSNAAAQTQPGELIRQFGYSSFNCVALSADGARFATGAHASVYIWDVATGEMLNSFSTIFDDDRHADRILAIAWNPDGTKLVTGSADDTARIWDASNGALLHTLANDVWIVNAVVFSPDGQQVLTGSYESAKLWNAETGVGIRTFSGHTGYIHSVAFSPDGTKVLTGSKDRSAKLWDKTTAEELQTFTADDVGEVNAVIFTPDGTQAVTGSGTQAKFWDTTTGELIRSFIGHARDVKSLTFSPDGTRFLVGAGTEAKLWDFAAGTEIQTFTGHVKDVDFVRFSIDGAQIFTAAPWENAKLWDVSTAEEVRTFDGHEWSYSADFSADGRRAFSRMENNTVLIRDIETGEEVDVLAGHPSDVWDVAFSADGAQALFAYRDGTAVLRDAATDEVLQTYIGHTYIVSAVAFSPDETKVLTGSWDTTAKLWDKETGELLRTFRGHTHHLACAEFSPDGSKVLTGAGFIHDNEAILWDAATGNPIHILSDHANAVKDVAFSPDGSLLLTAAAEYAQLWDAATGREVRRFHGHEGRIRSVEFAPHGLRAITGSADGTARLWNVASGTTLRVFRGHISEAHATLSPDGARLLTASGGYAVLWNNFDDADGDGLSDFWETFYGVGDPNDDPDEDGLTNLDEYTNFTNPTESDTDGDLYTDQEEVDADTNPVIDADFPGSGEGAFHIDDLLPNAGPVAGQNPVALRGPIPVTGALATLAQAEAAFAVYFGPPSSATLAQFDDSQDEIISSSFIRVIAPPAPNGIAAFSEVQAYTRSQTGELLDSTPPLTYTYGTPDVEAPVITLLGGDANVECGSEYTDPGATAADTVDGDISSSIIVDGVVDNAVPGAYVLTYDVADISGNAANSVTRTVTIADTQAPILTLNGSDEVISCGEAYVESGATATDGCAGDLTASIVLGGDVVDTSTPGTYGVTYDVSDNAGNAAEQTTRTVTVVDAEAPIMTLNGTDATISCGEGYTDPSATAVDLCAGELTANILVGGDAVDPNSPGTYVITYDVTDSAGNAATQLTRTVTVVDDSAPLISLIGGDQLLSCGEAFIDAGATAADACDGDLTAQIIVGGDAVDADTRGTYVITYDVADSAGNAATQITRTVTVQGVCPDEGELCQDFVSMDAEMTALAIDFGIASTDLDNDNLPEEAALALVGAVACGGGDSDLWAAAMNAYEINLNAVVMESDFDSIAPYRHAIAALMALSQTTQTELAALLAAQDITMNAVYEVVTCDAVGLCLPSALPGKTLDEEYEQFSAYAKALNEPFSGTGDLDGDGIDNATEYANVMEGAATLGYFVQVALDPALNGAEKGDGVACHASTPPRFGVNALADALLLVMTLLALLVVGGRRQGASNGNVNGRVLNLPVPPENRSAVVFSPHASLHS